MSSLITKDINVFVGSSYNLITRTTPLTGVNYSITPNTVLYAPLQGDIYDYTGKNRLAVSQDVGLGSGTSKYGGDTYRFIGQLSSGNNRIYSETVPITGYTYTMSIWFNTFFDGLSSGYKNLMTLGYDNTNFGNGVSLRVSPYLGKIQGLFSSRAWLASDIFSGITENTYHNLILTKNGFDGNMYFYLDGVVSYYTTTTNPINPTTCATLGSRDSIKYSGSVPIYFPTWKAQNDGFGWDNYNGYMSEWIIEDKYWTQTDVTNYYNSSK